VKNLIRQDIQNNPATPWHTGEILGGEGEEGTLHQEVCCWRSEPARY
jgi:hypothetical protein